VLPQLAVVAHLVAPTTSSTTSATDVEAAAMAAAQWFVDIELVPAAKLRGTLGTDLRACGVDNRCAAARLGQHGIDRALYVVANLATGVLTVEVLRADPAGVAATELGQIGKDVDAAIAASVRRALIAAGHRLGGRLLLDVTPAEASVQIGTSSVSSSSPIVFEAGKHTLEVRLSGFESERREVELVAGKDLSLQLTLLEEPSVLSSWWLWTIVGVAAAAAVAVPLAVVYGRGTDTVCHGNPPEVCSE
jgi:hypothetical protein